MAKPKAVELGILPYIRQLNWHFTVYSAVHSTLIYVLPLALALSVTINHRTPLNHLTFPVAPFPFPIRNGSPPPQGSRWESQWHSQRGIQVREDGWAQYQAKVRPMSHFIRIQLLISPYWFFLDDNLISDFWCLIFHDNIATNCSEATVNSFFFTRERAYPENGSWWVITPPQRVSDSECVRERDWICTSAVPKVNMRANALFLLDGILHAGQHNTNLRTQTHSCLVIHWKVNVHICMMFTSRSYRLSTFAWSLLLDLIVLIPIAFVPGGLGGSHGETQGIRVVGFAYIYIMMLGPWEVAAGGATYCLCPHATTCVLMLLYMCFHTTGVLILALGEQAPQRVHSHWKKVIALRQVFGCAVLEWQTHSFREKKTKTKFLQLCTEANHLILGHSHACSGVSAQSRDACRQMSESYDVERSK